MSSDPSSTSSEELERQSADIVSRLRTYFFTHQTKSYTWRLTQLQRILRFLTDNESALIDCLYADLHKPHFEASLHEIVVCQTECRYFMHHLEQWMKPVRVATPLNLVPAESFITREPYGVCLVLAPFNYPVQLMIMALIAAFAAGNVCVLKPSEMTPVTSAFLAKTLPRYVDRQALIIVEGAVPETTALLKQKFDYIFFTGSEAIGKVVMRAAAEHLTPVTLELGGKAPVIIERCSDLSLAARRILWGKCTNAGQACIAPDYVCVHESVAQKFIEECKKTLNQFYGNGPRDRSPHLARIINERHTQRLINIIEAAKPDIVVGGKYSLKDRFIEPTLLRSTFDGPAMQEEIFGPILPIITYRDLQHEVLSYVNSHAKPLGLYVFTDDKSLQKQIIDQTSSGGVCLNDVMMQFGNNNLPFGGVGSSGFGAYHGKYGFETFSHAKPVLNKSKWLDAPQRYPPYTQSNYKVFRYVSEIYRVNSATFNKMFKVVFWPIVALVVAQSLGVTIGFRSKL